jgi:hypothetical protein
MLSPLVWQRWAWCSSRSTVAVAVARVLGMSSSNPLGSYNEISYFLEAASKPLTREDAD